MREPSSAKRLPPPRFLSLGAHVENPSNLLESRKVLGQAQPAEMDQGGTCAKGEGPQGSREGPHAFLPLVGSLWAARSLVRHRLGLGGQGRAVALASQRSPWPASHLLRYPHLSEMGANDGELLPVSAGLAADTRQGIRVGRAPGLGWGRD